MFSSSIHSIRKHFTRSIAEWADAGTGTLSLLLNSLGLLLAWLFVPLESGYWRNVRENRRNLYPHVNFDRPTVADIVRVALQSVVLFVVYTFDWQRFRRENPLARLVTGVTSSVGTLGEKIGALGSRWLSGIGSLSEEGVEHRPDPVSGPKKRLQSILVGTAAVLAIGLAVLCITQPFDFSGQVIFLSIMLISAWSFTHIRARVTLMVLFVISVVVSGRYLWWRCTATLQPSSPAELFFSVLLLAAEFYAFVVTVLGYFQVCWVLNRKPYPLPADRSVWPTVDIFIPTYNESLEVIKPTVFAALNLDWPAEKLKVHLLDDGSRDAFREFAESVGVRYIKREEHNHAKAGNINHALGITNGEFIVIFDCDHVPSCDFLTSTVGWLVKDKKIALVQTPHHFYSPDPFEKNLHLERAMPIENSLFHDFIQKGNDTWNAVMFCGSSAVMRRAALMQIGGIAVETVTEDAHTSLKLNRLGWKSAFISKPVASGLSTESLSAHVGQRIRWARGMIQIFRLDNPLFGRGLTLGQRLCFFSGMFYFLLGIPRIIFLIAPLPFIFFDTNVIQAPGLAILAFVVPHLVHLNLSNEFAQRGLRFPLMGEIYDTVLSWYIAVPTTVALFAPHVGKFNVTTKGAKVDSDHLDWHIARPYLVLLALNAAGLLWLFGRAFTSGGLDGATILVNVVWLLYNMVILSAAVAVAVETVQERRFHRVTTRRRASLRRDDGTVWHATLRDFSQTGVNLEMPAEAAGRLRASETVSLVLEDDGVAHEFRGIIRRANARGVGIELTFRSLAEEKRYIAATFCRDHIWDDALHKPGVGLGQALRAILGFAGLGLRSIISLAPSWAAIGLVDVQRFLRWLSDFVPRRPRRREF